MPSERVLAVAVSRHIIDAQRPFSEVLDGIFGGISRPDIAELFASSQQVRPMTNSALSFGRRRAVQG
jgi:hypothetical protein